RHTKLRALKAHRDGALVLAISEDGKYLVSAAKYDALDDVALWDLSAGKLLHVRPQLANAVERMTFLPDRRTLIAREDDPIRRWRIDDPLDKGLHDVGGLGPPPGAGAQNGDERRAFTAALSPDRRVLAVADVNRTLRLVEVLTGKEVGHIQAGVQRVAITFAPDGRTVARASAGGLIQLFDWPTEKEILALSGHAEDVYQLAFSPDGTRLAS